MSGPCTTWRASFFPRGTAARRSGKSIVQRQGTFCGDWSLASRRISVVMWSGTTNNTGYGIAGWHGVNYTAHRLAAWLSGLVESPSRPAHSRDKGHVLHKCDNRRCCNPNHFMFGSYGDNLRDAYSKKRKTQPKGEAHANAKLTNEQAAEIRRRYAAGEYQVPLAKEYGVSQRTVSLIVRGETYK